MPASAKSAIAHESIALQVETAAATRSSRWSCAGSELWDDFVVVCGET